MAGKSQQELIEVAGPIAAAIKKQREMDAAHYLFFITVQDLSLGNDAAHCGQVNYTSIDLIKITLWEGQSIKYVQV